MQQTNQQKLLNLTEKLITFKSISPRQNGCLDFLHNHLQNLGFQITRLDRGQTSNFIARFGGKEPIFAFAGHIDVVPAGDSKKWSYDPFQLTLHNGRLYGRGIADMKGAISAFIIAVEEYIKLHNPDQGSIVLLITSDEESSAIDGTTVIVEYLKQQNQKLNYCLLGEPSSVNVLGDIIKVGRRGSLTGTLHIKGKQGHIAYPDLCENPIHRFAKALDELISYSWDSGTEFFPPSSLQFANINSGLGVTNVIPGSLYTNFNFRYNNLHSAESLAHTVSKTLDKHKLNYDIQWHNSARPFLSKNGKLSQVVQQAILEQQNITTSLKTDGGTSDGRFIIEICDEILELGLTNKSIHQINENIELKDLLSLTKIYYNILDKIFND